jgi:hypothetical protein
MFVKFIELLYRPSIYDNFCVTASPMWLGMMVLGGSTLRRRAHLFFIFVAVTLNAMRQRHSKRLKIPNM